MPRWTAFRFLFAGGLALAASLLLAATLNGWTAPLDNALRDARFQLSTRPAAGDIVFVDIDSASLNAVGVWPWPRRHYAELLDRLMALGADDVVFDIDFSTTSNPADDSAFAASLEAAGGYAYLAAFRQKAPDGSISYNLPIQQFNAAQTVAVNVALDAAGKVRSYPALMVIAGRIVPSAASVLSPTNASLPASFDIDYSINPASVPRIPAGDLLAGVKPAVDVAGKRVIVGASAVELRDFFVAPRYGIVPGALVQALAAETIAQRRVMPPVGGLATAALLLAFLLGAAMLLARARTGLTVAIAIAAVVAVETVAALAQVNGTILVNTVPIDLAATLLAFGALLRELFQRGEAKRMAHARLSYLARHDALTGALNRHSLADEITERLGRREDVAVVAVDLRRLREVNETLGYGRGDAVLREAASRLKQIENAAVGHLGGATFMIAMPAGDGPKSCATRVVGLLNAPYDLNGHRVLVSAVAGVTDSTLSGRSSERLLANADLALSIAKRRHGASFQLFDPTLDQRIVERTALDLRLRSAISSREIALAFQPQVDLATGRVVGAEALARWTDAELGVVSPAQFIPAAEETGQIIELGRQLLIDACLAASAWPDNMQVAVNVSPVQFQLSDVLADVRLALHRSGLAARRLVIEITEGIFLEDPEAIAARLDTLRASGVSVALDDFGTGYSSMAYLARLPIDKIKIDQSFVRQLEHSQQAKAIVRAIMAMAHATEATIVAEGIETPFQANWLREAGCDIGQGYLFGKPGTVQSLAKLAAAAPLSPMSGVEAAKAVGWR
ncbi:MAG TPA: EAL domain-containing protein [Devosia sp.]|nr:EAL domain-containing protein [Devosia sp.]